jgi:uncharacterized protein
MKILQIGVVAALVGVAVALAGAGRPEPARGSSPEARAVTVTGAARVEAVPDRAGLSFGVSTTAASAREAVRGNASKARLVIAALRGAGVARADIQTQDVSVQPSWNDKGQVDGFTARNSVHVRLRNVARTGAVVDAAVEAGATEASGPSFERSDRDELYRSALRRAFADARAKAATLAGEAGASVGGVLSIEEAAPRSEEPVPYYARALAAEDTPVEPGAEEVAATVTVTFSLA